MALSEFSVPDLGTSQSRGMRAESSSAENRSRSQS